MTIARLGLPTLIVVTKEDLMKQWQEAAEKFLGLTREDYGIIQGDVCDVKGKKLAIGMIHSLAKEGRYPDWAYDQWGLVCLDECHRVAADQFSNVCFNVPARLRLGLSATPDRQDGKEFVLHAHIGPVRMKSKQLSMTPKVLVYTSDWECPRVIQRRSDGSRKVVPLPHTPGKVGHVVKMLIKHTKRQQLLAELMYTAWTRKRKTIFFSDSLDHLDLMQSALYAMGVPHKDMGFYKGGMKKQDLDKSKGKPVVLATYGFAREGTDIPWLDCMVMGTPKSEIEQIVGRVLREYPNKPQPVVFDVQDLDSSVFAGYAQKRIAFYQRIGADIRHM
jgi:superfamily II DNA or RNA helicase